MKKQMKKLLSTLLLLAMLVSLTPIGGGETAQAATKLSKKTFKIQVGKKVSLCLKVNGKKVKATKVKWSSKNKKIAKISKKGVVTGVKKGETKIIAKYKKKKYTAKVQVTAKKSDTGNTNNTNTAEDDGYWKLTGEPQIVGPEESTGSYSKSYDAQTKLFAQREEVVDDSTLYLSAEGKSINLKGEWITFTGSASEPKNSYKIGEKINITVSMEAKMCEPCHISSNTNFTCYYEYYRDGQYTSSGSLYSPTKEDSLNKYVYAYAGRGYENYASKVSAAFSGDVPDMPKAGDAMWLCVKWGCGSARYEIVKKYKYTWVQ